MIAFGHSRMFLLCAIYTEMSSLFMHNCKYYLAVYTSKNSPNAAYFFPNTSQGPFPKKTGKGSVKVYMYMYISLLGDFAYYIVVKMNRFEKFFQGYHQNINKLDPYQDRHLVRSDLGPNCWQKLSADDI